MTRRIVDVIERLVLDIGEQVTRDYEFKRGVWEGMSVSNKDSLDKALTEIKRIVEEAKPVSMEQNHPYANGYDSALNDYHINLLKALGE